MRMKLWQSIFAAVLLMAGPVGFVGCSSTQQQGQEEAVASEGGEEGSNEASEQGNQEAGQQGGQEEGEGNNAAGEEGYGEGNSQENVEGYQGAEEEGGEGGMDEEQLVNDEGVAATEQQGDLQEIIEEMNQGGGDDAAAPAVTESMPAANNASDTSEPPGAAAAAATPDVENIATEPTPGMEAAPAAAVPSAPAAPGLPEVGSKMSYIVQKGDTLAKIATKVYGNASKWKEIADFTGVANPSRIYPGDVVYYQLNEATMAFASSYEALPRSEVQVQKGDSLSTIAGRVLGDSSSWKMIWRQNDNIDNPDKLEVGATIFYIAPEALTSALESMNATIAEVTDSIMRTVAQNMGQDHQVDGTDMETTNADWDLSNSSLDNFELETII